MIFSGKDSAAASERNPRDSRDAPDDDDPTLTDDMLEIYFASTRAPGRHGIPNIWRSTRMRIDHPWDRPEPVAELGDLSENSIIGDQHPGISGDGLTLWFSSDRDRGPNRENCGPPEPDNESYRPCFDIYVTEREDRNSPWSKPRRVDELSSEKDDFGPEPARSTGRISLYRDPKRELYEATLLQNGIWGDPIALSLNGGHNDLSGFFVSDLELWFVSDRRPGFGADIYRATRPSIDQAFETPVLVEGINTMLREDDPWLSPDGHVLYFTSSSPGNQEIYVAELPVTSETSRSVQRVEVR